MKTDQVGPVAAAQGLSGSLLDELAREGARRMLEAEVAAHVEALAGEVDKDGQRLVVRDGHHQPRTVTTSAGAIAVHAPRVNDKRIDEATGQRKRFASAILESADSCDLQPLA